MMMRRMVIWCMVLLVVFAVTIRVHGQLDSNGFLSIDCGLPANSSYVDKQMNLSYVSDDQFIDSGINSEISSDHFSDSPSKEQRTLRYFPFGDRNCYTLRSLTVGFNYLIRATFFYGNYDGLNKPPFFDIYAGADFWYTVDTTSFSYPEIILTATADHLQVCLVNTSQGTPFISSLHLRQLKKGMYDLYVNPKQSLISVWRYNLGASNHPLIRYPDDMHDRWWWSYTNEAWTEISTNTSVALKPDFEIPSIVMQTAATTSTTKENLSIHWSSSISLKYCIILHFAEIQSSSTTGRREFNIYGRGSIMSKQPYVPVWLSSEHKDFLYSSVTDFTVSLVATSNSTLPPLLNAIELYIIAPTTGSSTYIDDVAAIKSIKEDYKLNVSWSGDPCFPEKVKWNEISCYHDSNITRITELHLNQSGLTGSLSDHFGNLTALEVLMLWMNDLSGSFPNSLFQLKSLRALDITFNSFSGLLPTSLGRLSALDTLAVGHNNFSGSLTSIGELAHLKYLDLSYSQLSGFIPDSLDKTDLLFLDIRSSYVSTYLPPRLRWRQQQGILEFRYDSMNPTMSPSHKKNAIIIATAVVVPLLIIAIVIATVLWLRQRKYNQPAATGHNENYDSNRQFSYNELKKITNDFTNNIGTGGYGTVYLGILENGTQVAVKLHSQSSAQGIKEFSAEARNLTRVHHKNLVSLVGYCIDEKCMALVYEYMQEGSLHDKLKGNAHPLSWKQRLQIVYESALVDKECNLCGLEYLHKACNPPLVHRDVKSSNILLNANLEAKVADFGLSRALNSEASSHVLTAVVGTVGYLDPEYYKSNQLSAKSDVFSFGIVLLEITTGRPPIMAGLEGGNLVQWVHQKISKGDIKSIVDARMQEGYDINSVWKVADLAFKCTAEASSERPTMSVVVNELKESLDLEMHKQATKSLATDVSQDSVFEMAEIESTPTPKPGVR